MKKRFNKANLDALRSKGGQIFLSLYMPTQRAFPERNQNPIRYRNLLRQLRNQVEEQLPQGECEILLKGFEELANNHEFWLEQQEALAIFSGEDFFEVFQLQRPVAERTIVSNRPYLTPLVRIVQSADNYQVLCLTRDSVRLFEGNRDFLEEVELAPEVPRDTVAALGSDLTAGDQSGHPGGFGAASDRGDPLMHESGGGGKQDEIDIDRDRFFRLVDRAIIEHHSKPSGLPLLLAALPENQAFFRSVSHNKQLMESGIAIDPESLDVKTLQQKSWALLSERYKQRLNSILDQYGSSHGQGLASDQLDEIGQATLSGRVATLLVEADRQVSGKLEAENGEVNLDGNSSNTDVLDEVVLQTMENGGEVIVVPSELMPCATGAAAVFRY